MNNRFLKTIILGCIGLCIFGATFVQSATQKNQPLIDSYNSDSISLAPTDDTFISHDGPTEIQGAGPDILIRNEYGIGGSSGWACDGLTKFDVSSIPIGSEIISATLNYFYSSYRDTNPAGRLLTLYRITSEWDEETISWNTQPTYSGTQSAASSVPTSISTWMQWNVTTDVQAFVDGELDNFGWKITDGTFWGQVYLPTPFFCSKEYGSNEPFLEIVYTSGNHEFKTMFLFGRIANLSTNDDIVTFEAVNIRCLQFQPFGFIPYISGELITISNEYRGILTAKLIFALCSGSV